MCGRNSSSKYAGIPGITSHRSLVTNPKGELVPGWCMECCYMTYKQIATMEEMLPTSNEVNRLYKSCLSIVAPSAQRVAEIKGEPFILPPLSRPFKSGPQKDIRAKVSQLHAKENRCYLCRAAGGNSLDHIIPLHLGGADEIWNVALVHDECNSKKNGANLEETKKLFPRMKLPLWFEV